MAKMLVVFQVMIEAINLSGWKSLESARENSVKLLLLKWRFYCKTGLALRERKISGHKDQPVRSLLQQFPVLYFLRFVCFLRLRLRILNLHALQLSLSVKSRWLSGCRKTLTRLLRHTDCLNQLCWINDDLGDWLSNSRMKKWNCQIPPLLLNPRFFYFVLFSYLWSISESGYLASAHTNTSSFSNSTRWFDPYVVPECG